VSEETPYVHKIGFEVVPPAPKQGWTGKACPVCAGGGLNDDGVACKACAGTGDEFGDVPPPMTLDQVKYHYFNDPVFNRFVKEAAQELAQTELAQMGMETAYREHHQKTLDQLIKLSKESDQARVVIQELVNNIRSTKTVIQWLLRIEEYIPKSPDGTPAWQILDRTYGNQLEVLTAAEVYLKATDHHE
jgi:hypothetical protein